MFKQSLCITLSTMLLLIAAATGAATISQAKPGRPEDERFVVSGSTASLPPGTAEAAPSAQIGLPMIEGFEGIWPATGWRLIDRHPNDGGEYFWGTQSCRPLGGKLALAAIGGGAQGRLLPCGTKYPNNVDSWAIYGPFDLSQVHDARILFHF